MPDNGPALNGLAAPMPPLEPEDIERRLDDLEVKAAFAEDLVERLNDIVVRQQQQIDLLVQELLRLRQQSASNDSAGFRSLREELPPHY